jgi:hypothetical protein
MLRADFTAADVQAAMPKVINPILDVPRRKGVLAEVKKIDRSGRVYSEFIGSKTAWMGQFRDQPKLMTHLDDVPVSEIL